MNRSADLYQDVINLFEVQKRKFRVKKPLKGIAFDSNKAVKVPLGAYIVVDVDSRDDSRVIVANTHDQELYSIQKDLVG